MDAARVQELIEFYQSLSRDRLGELRRFYAEDVHFKDPFHDARGLAQIERILARMFERISEPSFRVCEWSIAPGSCFLLWEFRFASRWLRGGPRQSLRGVSHVRFGTDGRATHHHDYWDATELYAGLPLIGTAVRLLGRLAR